MGDVKHQHGMFTWTDLGIPDEGAGTEFYTKLFGWEPKVEDAGEYGTYTMLLKGGRNVGGLYAQAPEQQSQGIPPMWLSYVLVDDVDATTARVSGLGGNVINEPMDVMSAGRMSIIQDPTGGVVALWEARDHSGAEVFNEDGAMTWNELATRDLETARAFYSELLGWQIDEQEMPDGMRYNMITNGDRPNGGMLQMDENWPEAVPAHWMVYFAVDDVDASATKVQELGGSISVPPTDISVGRFAVVGDPQGGTFTLFKADPPS